MPMRVVFIGLSAVFALFGILDVADDIWAVEDCTELYSDDGTLLARGTADYSYGGDLCTVTIDCVGGQDVPIYAKLVMYEELLTDAKNIHG